MGFTIISLDIFQTLADVNQRIPEIWRGICKEDYAETKALQGARAILGSYPGIYEEACHAEEFRTMEEVYVACAEKAANLLDFSVSPREVAYHLMFQHAKAPFYEEVPACVEKLRRDYRVVLSSDSNHLMVDDLICRIGYERAFISDDLRSYKGDQKWP